MRRFSMHAATSRFATVLLSIACATPVFCIAATPRSASQAALQTAGTNAPAKPQKKKPATPDQDFPFQDACISADFPTNNVTYKGIAIKLGHDAYVCFDTDLLRMSAGWTGKFLNLEGVVFTGAHGVHPSIGGGQKFATPPLPGVADSSGAFADTRPEPFGPIPQSVGRWNGLYLHGTNVVLSYTVAGTKILEMPASVVANGLTGFVRNFKIEKTAAPVKLMICEVPGVTNRMVGNRVALTDSNGVVTVAQLAHSPRGAQLAVEGNRIVLKLAEKTSASVFKLALWNGPVQDEPKFAKLVSGRTTVADVTKGGPGRWPQTVETRGVLDSNHTPDGAYAVDQLTPPTDNPWKRQVRFSGFDFFPDGHRAALSTWDGDIWIVSGIDEGLQHLTWKRFASGMYETLGLKIVDGVIYTSGRDQITRYHDLNNDGEADFFENFNNQITSSDGFHEFVFDLQTDSQGNFFFAKAGPVRPGGRGFAGPKAGTVSANAGTLMRLSKDGSKLEVYATGFRAPNGIGIGPHDEITTGDNEGSWVPQCPINWIRKGGYYGVMDTAHHNPVPPRDPPLCWLDWKDVDNSSGGQVWVSGKKWGPFEGDLLHLSYGKCALYLVVKEQVGGVMQGGVVRIPVSFTSTAMRGRFNPVDGQLYVAGLQGWQTTAVKPTGFDRVRYTGKPVHSLAWMHVTADMITLTFTRPLDPASANDVENYSSKRWAYRPKGDNYGADEISIEDPQKTGRDVVNITSVKLSPDKRTVELAISGLKPVPQMSIKYNLKAADGMQINQEVQFTINRLP